MLNILMIMYICYLKKKIRTEEKHKYYQAKNYWFSICWAPRAHDFVNISDVEERRGGGFVSEGVTTSDGGWRSFVPFFSSGP